MRIMNGEQAIYAQAASNTIEISVRGRWVSAPALRVNGQVIAIEGTWIKIAHLHNEDEAESEVADPEACIRALKEQGSSPRTDIFCFSQLVPDTSPRYKYPMEMQSIAVAYVADCEKWLANISRKTRHAIRRSKRLGVVIRMRSFDAETIQGIRDVQNETPVRQGRPYWHYGKTLEQVRQDHCSFAGRSDFMCAYCGGEFIGFVKLVYCGGFASILQMISKMAHYDKCVSNALIAKAVERCAEKHIPYLTYGLFNYGNKGDSSLCRFKVRNGFTEMLVPRYYVPLTAWGRICVKTRLYRSWHDMLPHKFIAAASTLRAKWHARRGWQRVPAPLPEK